MRPTFVHGIIVLLLTMALAALAKPASGPAGVSRADRNPSYKADSALSVPETKPARAKPGKSAAPLAKPETGEDTENKESKEAEEAADCDDCVLASPGQVIIIPGLMQAGLISA